MEPLVDNDLITETGPWDNRSFDLHAAAQAYKSLPSRSQEVLWYTEIENLPPREVAKFLGITSGNVASLSSRAREALRSAWVEEHVNRELANDACRFTLTYLQRYQRGKLTAARSRDVEAHLAHCSSCEEASREFAHLNKNLALMLTVILVGGGSTAAMLAALRQSASHTPLAHVTPTMAPSHNASGRKAAKVGKNAGAPVTLVAAAGTVALIAVSVSALLLSQPPGSSIATPDPAPPVSPVEQEKVSDGEEREIKAEEAEDVEKEFPPESYAWVVASAPDLLDSRSSDRGTLFGHSDPEMQRPVQEDPVPGDVDESPPVPGSDPPSNLDPNMAVGFDCYLESEEQGFILSGVASEYGALQAQITQPPSTEPVPLITHHYLVDAHGNEFTDIFSGTDPEPSLWWWTPSVTPLERWPGLAPGEINDVVLEMRLIAPDGRFSPWTTVILHESC